MSGAAHTLVAGPQGCGKSTVMEEILSDYQRSGIQGLVLDPHAALWPVPAHHRFTDPLAFLALAKRSQRCVLVIDEAGECIGRGKHARDMQWVTTGARKYGHVTYLLVQEAQQLLPVIRSQCRVGIIFRQSERNARLLVDTFADKRAMQATELGEHEFLHIVAMGDCRRMKLNLARR